MAIKGKDIANMLYQLQHYYGKACKELITSDTPKELAEFLRTNYTICCKLVEVKDNLPQNAFSKLCYHVNKATKEGKSIPDYAKEVVELVIAPVIEMYKTYKVSYDIVYKDDYIHYEEEVSLDKLDSLRRGAYVRNLIIL